MAVCLGTRGKELLEYGITQLFSVCVHTGGECFTPCCGYIVASCAVIDEELQARAFRLVCAVCAVVRSVHDKGNANSGENCEDDIFLHCKKSIRADWMTL